MGDYKIVVFGSGGKSALTIQFVQDVFLEKHEPTIEDCYRKQLEVDGEKYMIDILDTAGKELYSNMLDHYVKNSEGFVLVYSVTSRSTFNAIQDFREQIIRVKKTDDVPMILVGNKCDLEDKRVVSKDEGANLARSFNNCAFFESSAKTKINVSEIFYEIIRQINRKNPERNIPPKRPTSCSCGDPWDSSSSSGGETLESPSSNCAETLESP